MNYELAKELKEAGFPQEAEENGSYYALPLGYTFMMEEWRKDLSQPEIPAKLPRLEELIAACGNDFYQLEQYQGNGEWVARAYVEDKIISTKFDVHNINEPDTVVALLWLVLNKK